MSRRGGGEVAVWGLMSEIVVIGSLNADLVVGVERAPVGGETVVGRSLVEHCGGKGANQAYAAGKLGGKVAMIGRIGEDGYGERQVANLRAVGVDTEGVRAIEGVGTGTAVVLVDASAENRIVVIPGANAAFGQEEMEEEGSLLRGARYALFQLETTMEGTLAGLRAARKHGVVTVLDPAPAQPLTNEMLGLVDYLTPNVSELRTLTGDALADDVDEERIARAARRLILAGAGKVVAKLGAAGALLVDGSAATRVFGYKVEAVDTTAAGDCFNAAFAVGLCRGMEEVEAIDFACAAAGLGVTRHGAQSGMPSLAEVEKVRRKTLA